MLVSCTDEAFIEAVILSNSCGAYVNSGSKVKSVSQNRLKIQQFRFSDQQRRTEAKSVCSSDHLLESSESEFRHDATDVLGQQKKIVNHVFRFAFKLRSQHWILTQTHNMDAAARLADAARQTGTPSHRCCYLNNLLDSTTIILSPAPFNVTHCSHLLIHSFAISLYINVLQAYSFILKSHFNLIILLCASVTFIKRICYVKLC